MPHFETIQLIERTGVYTVAQTLMPSFRRLADRARGLPGPDKWQAGWKCDFNVP